MRKRPETAKRARAWSGAWQTGQGHCGVRPPVPRRTFGPARDAYRAPRQPRQNMWPHGEMRLQQTRERAREERRERALEGVETYGALFFSRHTILHLQTAMKTRVKCNRRTIATASQSSST